MTTHRPTRDPLDGTETTPSLTPSLTPSQPRPGGRQGPGETTPSPSSLPVGGDGVNEPSAGRGRHPVPESGTRSRHAAIVDVSLEAIRQALGLPDTVELKGIVGLPLNPAGVIQVVLVHDNLPTVHEACWPPELTIDQALDLIAADDTPPTCSRCGTNPDAADAEVYETHVVSCPACSRSRP